MADWRRSVASLVVFVLLAIFSVALLVGGFLGHVLIARQAMTDFRAGMAVLADGLATGLALPAWNIDRPQIDKVVESAMRNRDVYSVVATVAGKHHALVRDGDWNIVPSSSSPAPDGLEVVRRTVMFNGEELGSVTLSVTSRFVKERLRRELAESIAEQVVVQVVMAACLYFLLWRLVLRPILRLEAYAMAAGREDAAPDPLPERGFFWEFDRLRVSLQEMVQARAKRVEALRTSEAALRESEERFRRLFNGAPDPVFLHDRDGHIVDVNEVACEKLGYPRDELLAMTIADIDIAVPAGSRPSHWDEMQAGHVSTTEGVHRRRDGTTFPVEVRVTPFVSKARPLFFAAARDITERKAMDAALRERTRYIETVMENSPIGYAVVSTVDGRARFVSRRFEEICGVPPGTIDSSDAFFDTLFEDPEERRVLRQRVEADQASGDPERLRWEEVPIRLESGEVRLLTGTNIEVPSQQLRVTTLQDVTERHRTHEALRASESKYRRLYESMTDAAVTVDMSGRILECNPAFEALIGYPFEDLRRMRYQDVTPARWHDFQAHIVAEQVIPRGASDIFEKEYRRKDGTIVPIELRLYLLRDEAGQPAGMWAIVRDLEERKRVMAEHGRLQALLIQAQKMEAIGQLAGGVAHDFNNILSAILMQLSLLKQEALPADIAEGLHELENHANRATELTRQLLTFSRRQAVQRKVLELNTLVGNLLRMLRRLIGEHVALEFSAGAGSSWVEADAGMLEQVVMNLVVNARDAMPDGGRIAIRTGGVEVTRADVARRPDARAGQFVCLEVTDTGSGMSEEVLSHIFEPFFTTKEPGRGTGLGLATVYGVVEQHQGWVEVESRVGQGTTFRVFLPTCAGEDSAEFHSAAPQPAATGGEQVLIVEDEVALRRLMVRALERLGYVVHAAGNGAEAVTLYRSLGGRVDLVVSDMVMPGGMTGLDLAQRLLGQCPSLKVILMSGYSPTLPDSELLRSHGIHFLAKPLNLHGLGLAVRQALGK